MKTMPNKVTMLFVLALALVLFSPAIAQDVPGSQDHPAITRYPGSVIKWYKVENYMPYKIAAGPVTGYRAISEWIETEGRVTRIFYELTSERTHSEVYKNFKDALTAAQFDIFIDGFFPERNVKGDVGGNGWIQVAMAPNPHPPGSTTLFKGTSTVGGTAAVFAKKERAEGTLYVMVYVRQFSAETVIVSIDVVEEEVAETGFVVANADAMGADIEAYGKVALYGLYFDHDKATLQAASKPALDEVAKLLKAHPEWTFYVVGHTDMTGTLEYNRKLSRDRAEAVITALVDDYQIARARLEADGVGPLVPVFTNQKDAGRAKNRRVELVLK
jgi:OmpA-OmpF porin, OOP family